MMPLNQCDNCVHERVCKVLDYLRRADVKAMITSCRDHFVAAPTLFDLDKHSTQNPRDFSSGSLAELSRKIHDAVDKDSKPNKPPKGTKCSNCGNEDPNLVQCEACGKWFCYNCVGFTTDDKPYCDECYDKLEPSK